MKHSLFIADLHLSPERPLTTRMFEDFARSTASRAEALYILGDLFEYWAGDDDLSDPHQASVADSLAELGRSGTKVFLMHGNRDFLVAADFADAAHSCLIPDPTLIDLYSTPTLLTHGDTLCIDDTAYLAFRTQVRGSAWQKDFLAQPLAQRKASIAELRRRSETDKQHKSVAEMDVHPDAVAALLRAHAFPRLIHGHTHRPARHLHEVDGHLCERWVLSDWGENGSFLCCDPKGCVAKDFPPPRKRG
jgi:UDP-2,3-diacylglucosamine hydrolase